MDLLQDIKSERARKRRKPPLRRTLFDRINGLVKEYALGESFLRRLDGIADHFSRGNLEFDRVRAKEHFEPPLFALSTREEYYVTMAIIDKVNNPYLHFVNSPDEILLRGLLFRCNPSIEPDRLARYILLGWGEGVGDTGPGALALYWRWGPH